MRIEDHVDWFLKNAPVGAAMAHVAEVCRYDRYQASEGIADAAEYVARAAREAGLADAEILRFETSPTQRWWTFRSPQSWSPQNARLEIWRSEGRPLVVDHAKQPFSIAVYSSPTRRGGLDARLILAGPESPEVGGAICLVGRGAFREPNIFERIEAAGAVGFVSDGPCRRDADGTERPGRIELRPGSGLFGFSVTHWQFQEIEQSARAGSWANARVEVQCHALMPVVTGTLPGSGGEIWLTAHLCHPRPGANDNASGVAALLAVAAALRARNLRGTSQKTVRFLWAPEFVGLAAYLHRRSASRMPQPLPEAVINLDMVGEDQALCESPFLVERQPGCIAGPLTAFAEHVVGAVFSRTGDRPGRWESIPHQGFSDHFLFGDANIDRPAIQFCHAADRFNHSAADTIDKVSPLEMRRSIAAAASLVTVLATPDSIGQRHRDKVVDAWRGERASDMADRLEHAAGTSVLTGLWPGPFNARAMQEELPPDWRARVAALMTDSKRNLSILNNIALRANRNMTRAAILDDVSREMVGTVDLNIAVTLLDSLVAAGWCEETPVIGTD